MCPLTGSQILEETVLKNETILAFPTTITPEDAM
jgi:hypothetical protein